MKKLSKVLAAVIGLSGMSAFGVPIDKTFKGQQIISKKVKVSHSPFVKAPRGTQDFTPN